MKTGFSENFKWGVSTAAFQIEGAIAEDKKTDSIWDTASKTGRIFEGHKADIACDHYHRFLEDVKIMKEIGVQAYRLSLSWPRLIPDETGVCNQKGFEFYHKLFDALLENGIEPYVTLFHWDLPEYLHHQGGWLNKKSSDWFARYAECVAKEFGDQIQNFITINEFQSYLGLGYCYGTHAPFEKLPLEQLLEASHNSLLAHGKAVLALRNFSKKKVKVAVAPCGVSKLPVREKDIEAARIATFAPSGLNISNNAWFMDPIYLGHYPEDHLKYFGCNFKPSASDLEIISQKLDYFGVNIYNGSYVEEDGEGGYKEVPYGAEIPRSMSNFAITPEAMYYTVKFFYDRYHLPIVITENGISLAEWKAEDGKIHDFYREEFIRCYLKQLKRVAEEGVPLEGYFYWTLVDNFEWMEGFHQKFGLVHLDTVNQNRTIKESGYYYKKVIESNGKIL